MKALIDTNVLLDTLLERKPFHRESDRIFDLVSEGKIDGCVSIQSLKDVFYFCKKTHGEDISFGAVEKLSLLFEIIDVSSLDSVSALMSDVCDYEDGLLLFSAQRNNVEAIITKNTKDFFESGILVIHPHEIDKYLENPYEVGSIEIE